MAIFHRVCSELLSERSARDGGVQTVFHCPTFLPSLPVMEQAEIALKFPVSAALIAEHDTAQALAKTSDRLLTVQQS